MSQVVNIKYKNNLRKIQIRQNIPCEDLQYLLASYFDLKGKIIGIKDKNGNLSPPTSTTTFRTSLPDTLVTHLARRESCLSLSRLGVCALPSLTPNYVTDLMHQSAQAHPSIQLSRQTPFNDYFALFWRRARGGGIRL